MAKSWPTTKNTKLTALLMLSVAIGSTARAMAQTGAAGRPASTTAQEAAGQPSAGGPGTAEEQPVQATPEVAPLSGARVLTPGSASEPQSYLLPSFQWTIFANSNPSSTTVATKTAAQNTFVGNLTLQRARRNSQLNLEYAGGGLLYSGGRSDDPRVPEPSNGTFHRLSFNQTISWQRWELAVSDQFTLLPESPFGFAGFGGLSSFGAGLGGSYLASGPVVSPAVEPDQSILTTRARRLGNVALAEVEYVASPRSAITATAAYGNLHFLDEGFLDSSFLRFMTGYNYALTRLDTLALSYSHVNFYYDLQDFDILNHSFLATYGRRLTGRLSLQLSAGPLLNRAKRGPGNPKTRFLLETYDSLQYKLERGNLKAAFSHSATGGAGVLTGAESNVASFSVGHQLSRKFFSSFRVAYALNKSLATEDETGPRPQYRTFHGSVNFSREFGERTSIYFVYYVQRQNSNVPLRFDSSSGEVLLRHVVGMGFNWHGRPIRLD